MLIQLSRTKPRRWRASARTQEIWRGCPATLRTSGLEEIAGCCPQLSSFEKKCLNNKRLRQILVPRRGNGCPRLRRLIFIGKISLEGKGCVAGCRANGNVGVDPEMGHEPA
jgi:hypothetical protein